MAHSAFRLGKQERLIRLQELHSQPVEEMEEVAEKADAIQDDKLDAAILLVQTRRIVRDIRINPLCRDENVIIELPTILLPITLRLLSRLVDIIALHVAILHLVNSHDLVICDKHNFDIAERACLLVSRRMFLERH